MEYIRNCGSLHQGERLKLSIMEEKNFLFNSKSNGHGMKYFIRVFLIFCLLDI